MQRKRPVGHIQEFANSRDAKLGPLELGQQVLRNEDVKQPKLGAKGETISAMLSSIMGTLSIQASMGKASCTTAERR